MVTAQGGELIDTLWNVNGNPGLHISGRNQN